MSRLIFDADTLGGTTTLSSADAVGNFTLIVPAVDGTLSVKDSSGDATFRNLTLTGAVLAGAWNGTRIGVAYGGTGATTLTGYVKGNGTSAMTASATIPSTDITGLGTMSVQNANAVAITGGTISGLSAAIPVASGGTGATTLTGYVKGNGTSLMTASATIPNTDITGLGTMSTQNANAVAITGGTISGLGTALAVASGGTGATTLTGLVYGNGTSAMTAASAAQVVAVIGSTAVANATLAATATLATTATNIAGGLSGSIPYQTAAGTTSLLAAGTNGQVLTLAAGIPSWVSVTGVGTVTSVDGSGGTTGLTLTGGPITSSGTLTLGGTLAAVNGGTGQSSYVIGNVLYASTTTALSKLAIGTTGQVLTVAAGIPSWATPTTGTVTSVGFTGGIVSVATATTTPALTVAGTSGGIPYFSSASTWATSAALAANALVIGGGAGVAPSTITTGTGVATALGVNVGTAGSFVANGDALGTPSSGTVTNLTGTASININGTVGATTTNTGAFTTLSASSTVSGTGFSTYLASPPAIGGTAPSTGKFTTLTNSGLTSGRVTYAGTGGLLQDSANLTFNGTTLTAVNDASINGLTVGKGASAVATNTAVGVSALAANTTGTNSVAIGYQAGFSQTTGSGQGNEFIGSGAGYANTTGYYNTVVGRLGLNANTTGAQNVAVGLQALTANTTATNNVAVGVQSCQATTTGGSNTGVGASALYTNTTGVLNSVLGAASGYGITTGNYNTIIGTYQGSAAPISATGANWIVLSDGQAVIGAYYQTSGANGWFQKNNSAAWSITSDIRIKKNVESLDSGLSIIAALRPVEFDYIKNDKHDIGFIAQEYQTVLPNQIAEDADGMLSLNQNLVPYLVKAIQELKAEIEELKGLK